MSNVAAYRRARGDVLRRLAFRVGIVGLLLSWFVFPQSAFWQHVGAASVSAADWLRHKTVVVLGGTPKSRNAAAEFDLKNLSPVNGYPSSEIRCLALAIYHEAGGDRTDAQLAVAQIALNRAAAFKHPKSICRTIYTGLNTPHGCLFEASCRNIGSTPTPGKSLAAAAALATEIAAGRATPKTAFGKVTHFHDMKVSPPSWTRTVHRIGRLGRLDFYAPEPFEEAKEGEAKAAAAPQPPPQRTQRVPSQPRRETQSTQNGTTRAPGDLASQVFGQ